MKISVLAVAGALAVASAEGAVVDIGGGWQASWDSSLDSVLEVFGVTVVGDTTIIQKAAEFTTLPQVISVTFTQIAPDATPFIAIDDEIITNSTGMDWADFHMTLDDAVFDPARTATSGGAGPLGFTIAPYLDGSFNNGNTSFDIDNGVVTAGSQWFPGNGASDGLLFMSASPTDGVSEPFTSFVLNEQPVPAPMTLAFGAVLAAGTGLRRRRA